MGYKMFTKSGKNFFEVASLIQKAVRRADYNRAGWCANELFEKYQQYLWRKLFIISAEDCFGAVTGKVLELYHASQANPASAKVLASMAVIVLCQCRKNKDADYFGCNYMHSEKAVPDKSLKAYVQEDRDGCIECLPGFRADVKYTNNGHTYDDVRAALSKAILNREYAKAGYVANDLYETDMDELYDCLSDISFYDLGGVMTSEINSIRQADSLQKEREKIFPGKAIVLLLRQTLPYEPGFFEWDWEKAAKPIPIEGFDGFNMEECFLPNDEMPDWVFSWHTSKGKAMGRDCVDSIIDDQFALNPLQESLFDWYDWKYHIDHALSRHNPKNRPHVGIDWNAVKKAVGYGEEI